MSAYAWDAASGRLVRRVALALPALEPIRVEMEARERATAALVAEMGGALPAYAEPAHDLEWRARMARHEAETEARRDELTGLLWPSKLPRYCWTCGVELSAASRGNGFCGRRGCKGRAGETAERRAS